MPVMAQLQRRCTRSAASGSPSIARTIGAMSMIMIILPRLDVGLTFRDADFDLDLEKSAKSEEASVSNR
jgi:hypothetical protein